MNDIVDIKNAIYGAESIAISGHLNPDGDSIGSILALGLGLEQLRKRVYILSRDGVPKRFRLLPGADRIIRRTTVTPDLAISVDCGEKKLLGDTYRVFKRAKKVLEIDHHEYRKPFGDILLIDTKVAAVGELVYTLLGHLGVEITGDIAQNILTSIIVETSSFRLPNIRPTTFEICARLAGTDVDLYRLAETVFWSRRREAVVLLGVCLSRSIFLKRGKIVWSIVRAEDFRTAGGVDEDVDPVADELRSIKGVEIAIFFRDKENGLLRVSLRSKGRINVAAIAERFGGGGHFDAAGCHIENSEKAMAKLLSVARSMLK